MRLSRKIGYGLGDLGISISYFAVGFFYMFYLTDIVGMAPYLAGLAIFIGKLWDGINDPIIGIINDQIKSRFGRKRSFLLFGSLPFALSFFILWLIPVEAAVWVQFSLAVVSLLIYATAYSIVVVPYMSLVPVMSQDYNERTQITGIRAVLSTFGIIMGGGIAMWISSFENQLLGLHSMAIGFGILTFLSILIAARSVRGMELEDQPIVSMTPRQYLKLATDKNVMILLLLKFFGAIGTGSLSASIPYFSKYVLGDPSVSSKGLAIYVLASALCIPVWNRLTHTFEKRHLLLFSNVLTAFILAGIGFFVAEGAVTHFYIGCVFLGIIMSAYLLIPYSLVPDLVDYSQVKSGQCHESVFFGMWIMMHQLGLAGAGLIIGLVFTIMGYDSSNLDQTDSIHAVRLVFGLIPGLFLVLGALVLQKYEITREYYDKIKSQLEA